MKKYALVADGEAGEIERLTGLRGHNTPQGALVEWRDPVVESVRLGLQLEAIERALHPPPCECRGFFHRPECRIGGGVT